MIRICFEILYFKLLFRQMLSSKIFKKFHLSRIRPGWHFITFDFLKLKFYASIFLSCAVREYLNIPKEFIRQGWFKIFKYSHPFLRLGFFEGTIVIDFNRLGFLKMLNFLFQFFLDIRYIISSKYLFLQTCILKNSKKFELI